MKNLLAFVFCICFTLAAHAQLNSDTTRSATRASSDRSRKTVVHNHMHPKIPNLGNPGTGYEMDGAVIHREAIVNRHATSINQLIQ